MKVIALEGTHLTLHELAEMAESEPVIVTREGRPFLSIHEFSPEEEKDARLMENPVFLRLIEESRRQHRTRGSVGLDAIREELGL